MTNVQLYIAVGLPVIAVLASMVPVKSSMDFRISRMSSRIPAICTRLTIIS